MFLFGAFGHLHCVELATGKEVWDMEVREQFGAGEDRKWGTCSSPLIVDDKLVVNPGGPEAALVALEPRTAKVIWKTPGKPASYGSLIAETFGGKKQIVGFDADSLGGWDVASGKRLWQLMQKRPSAFNVPTPVRVGEQLLIANEENGANLYRFDDHGIIDPNPLASIRALAPDTHTPVAVGKRVFGICKKLYCLDTGAELKPSWVGKDDAFTAHASILACKDRLLVTSLSGELLLIDGSADQFTLVGRLAVLKDEEGCYAHPALVGTRLYLRGNSSVLCVELKR